MKKQQQAGELCLMCGQPLPLKKGRVCGICGKPILKGHKYRFEGSTVKHRNCDDPMSRKPKEVNSWNKM